MNLHEEDIVSIPTSREEHNEDPDTTTASIPTSTSGVDIEDPDNCY